MKKSRLLGAVCAAWMVFGTSIANAAGVNLITNGTFDTDLSGWDTTGTTTGVTWVSGTAHVGQSGTPGEAIFTQSFDIAAGTSALQIDFDYEWQINQPTSEDTFTAEFIYESTAGTLTSTILTQGSNSGLFGTTVTFSDIVALNNLDTDSPNGWIRFTLLETNDTNGTRIELDNVFVGAVPIPAAAWLFGSVLFGITGVKRYWNRKA